MSRRSPSPPIHSKDQRRLIAVALFLLLFSSFLVVQFFRIQIVQHEKWDKKALAQHTKKVQEPFRRGLFFSNTSVRTGHPNGEQPLVIDVPKFHVFIDPKGISEEHRDAVCSKLTAVLGLEAKAREQFDLNSRCRGLARWVDPNVKEEIESWWHTFAKANRIPRNAVFFEKDYKRSYPFGKLMGQLLHTVRDFADETSGQRIPTGGLELCFNEYLQGKKGERIYFRSPRHAMDIGKVITPPVNGADVYLTLNHHLQAIAEEEVERQVLASESKRGWAIMLDPHTGDVLALAQYPFFYPENYRDYFNREELLEETQVKAVTEPFEPGSTMKAISIAVCLLANAEREQQGLPPLFDPIEMIPTPPTMFPGRTRPIKDVSTHSYLNMYLALQKSSNVYVGKMINRVIDEMGEMWYRSVLQNIFGMGQRTGIELPAESPGLLPMPGKVHPNGTLEWSKPTPYSLAMGHNILCNSFQVVRAFAIIANGGYDVHPTLVRKIVRKQALGEDQIFIDHVADRLYTKPRRLLSEEITRKIVNGLKLVKKARIHGYTSAGKSSTSEKIIDGKYSKRDHISSFIGFAPADDPKFVLLVVMDEPVKKYIPGVGGNQFGSICAAPAYQRIARRSLHYLGVEPDDPNNNSFKKVSDAIDRIYQEWNP